MYCVYLIQSESAPGERYTGFTSDLKRRMADHNSGQSVHTAKSAPWKLIAYHAFADKQKAQDFERYLKTGSGQAFSRKRFW